VHGPRKNTGDPVHHHGHPSCSDLRSVKKAILVISVLATVLVVALAIRLFQLRSEGQGPPGGTGVVEGVDVHVVSRIPARIAAVEVREGDLVTAGQVVVRLDCAEPDAVLEQARAQLAAATATFDASAAHATSATQTATAANANVDAMRSQLAVLESQQQLAKIELDRTRKLVDQRAIPIAELDHAMERYRSVTSQIDAQRAADRASRAQAGAVRSTGAAAKSQSTAAERNIDVARAAVTHAEVAVRECTLVAPRAGMVATRAREPGEPVQPGSVILTITDLTDARTRFYLPNSDLAAAYPGRDVRVVADAYPDRSFEGTIYYVSPHAEFTPRNVQTREDRERLVYAVEVRIPNPDLALRAGMPVEVFIESSPTATARTR